MHYPFNLTHTSRAHKEQKKIMHDHNSHVYAHTEVHRLNNLIQMITQKQVQPRGGKRQKMTQSDCVLCTNSLHCNPKCFSKSAWG